MKKISKVFFALVILVGICFITSCKTDPKPNEELKTQEVRKALEEIELDTSSVKLDYFLGQEFNSSGLKVLAKFNDNTKEDVSSKVKINSQSFDSSAVGDYMVLVSYEYEGRVRSANYSVHIKTLLDNIETYIVGLEIGLGTTTYNVNDELDLSDLSVTAIYSDETKEVLDSDQYSVNSSMIDKTKGNISPLVVSTKKTYQSGEVNQEVEIKSFIMITYLNPLVSIEFKSGTVEFAYGSKFSMEDWKVEATYTNGEKGEVTGFTINKRVNTHLAGTIDLVISYTEMKILKICSVSIVVQENSDPNAPFKYSLNANDLDLNNSLREPLEVDDFITINSASNKINRIDANSKTYVKGEEEFSFTKRINLNGGFDISSRNIQILVPKAGTVRVIFSQGKPGRKLVLEDGKGYSKTSETATVDNNTLVEWTFTVEEAGFYYLGSYDGGIYIWYIEVNA